MLKRAAGLKVKQPEKPPPYTYEVVKAQLPFSDENHFFTEISRSHLHHQQAPFFWTPPPIQERRNLPKVFFLVLFCFVLLWLFVCLFV